LLFCVLTASLTETLGLRHNADEACHRGCPDDEQTLHFDCDDGFGRWGTAW